jgi:Ca2+-binding RTX toxin-like protein
MDVLVAGPGDDLLEGGAASDTFVFQRNAGDNEIVDFQDNVDVIDLTRFGLDPASFASVVAPALSVAAPDATLLDLTQLGGEGSVLIGRLALADADASDFVL